MQTSAMQIPPPKDWQEFERLCCDLWSRIWGDPSTCQNGRQGQPQHGVDVYGCPQKGGSLAGVQCKGKDNYTNQTLTEVEVNEEVKKAKEFKPALSEYIIATSGVRDEKIQEVVRKISEEHKSKGIFSVNVLSWDDIVLKLQDYPDLLNKYYPEIYTNAQIVKKMDVLEQCLRDSHAQQEITLTDIGQKVAQVESRVGGAVGDNNERIDYGRDLIKQFKPAAAKDYYNDLKNKIWNRAQPLEKYRVLTNLGMAELALGHEGAAAKYYLEAFQYNPEDDKAICNRAFGHYLLGQPAEALEYANKALEKNPANCHACSLLIRLSPAEDSFESVLNKIPTSYRDNPEVAHSLGFAALDRKLFGVAREWMETALEKDPEKSPDLKAAVATALINEVSQGELLFWFRITEDQKPAVRRAVELYTSAWETLSEPAHKKAKISWLANRSLARRVLNDVPGSAKDIESLLELDPENPDYIKRQAFLAYEAADYPLAGKLLEKIQNNPQMPEAAIMLAEVLARQNKKDAAITLLQKIVEAKNPKLIDSARELLMQVYIATGKYEEAKSIAEKELVENPADIFALIVLSKGAQKQEDKLELLLKANQHVKPSTHPVIVQGLADEFYSVGEWEYSIPLYERCVGDAIMHPGIKNLILALYQAGKHGKALGLCEKALKQPKPPEYVAEIASSIYEDIGNLDRAKQICQECLNNYPDSMSLKLRLALINYRRNDFAEVDIFLASEIKLDSLSLSDGAFLANLYLERNSFMKAFEIMYEIRRKYYSKYEAHLKYIGIMLRRNKPEDELLKTPEVTMDTAVLVKNESDERNWYVIEKREHYAHGEVDPQSSLGKLLMGKKVGDRISVKVGTSLYIQIEEIKNKYVRAFQESMANFNQLFPDSNSMVKMNVEVPKKVGEVPDGLQIMISQLEQQNSRIQNIVELYKSGNLTVGGFSALSGKNIWEVWLGLTAAPGLGIRCCIGTAEERAFALSSLDKPFRLVCDILTLFTLAELKLGDIVVNCFGKPAIAQSTLDALAEIVKDLKTFPRTMTVTSENGRLRSQQHNPEWEKENTNKLEALLDWTKRNCEVVPATAALEESDNRLCDLEELLGKSFVDSIFIAKEIGGLLYSEDERLRSLAKSEFGIDGVWTQVVLIACSKTEKLSKQEYNAATLNLVTAKYFHIAIDAELVVHAAKEAKWSPGAPFNVVVERLGKQYCDQTAALGVGVGAIWELYQQPILPIQRAQLVLVFINSLMKGRSTEFLGSLKKNIRIRFGLLPFAEQEIQGVVSAWESLHLRR